jgi:hypothetical protein
MKRLLISMAIVAALVGITIAPVLADQEASVAGSVTVNAYVSITLTDTAPAGIDFGDLPPGTNDQGATGQVTGTPAIAVNVAPETNLAVDIGIKGATTTSLALANWKYSTTFAGTKTGLTTGYVTIYTSAPASSNNAVYHWITIPSGTAAGAHTATIYYKAIPHGGSYS